jgi:hypothetical protein
LSPGGFAFGCAAMISPRRRSARVARHLWRGRRYEEQQRKKRDDNRWRDFREAAQDWRELAAAWDFLSALRSMDVDPSIEINGRSLAERFKWVEDWLQRADPTANGLEDLFNRVNEITEWSYRD